MVEIGEHSVKGCGSDDHHAGVSFSSFIYMVQKEYRFF
jgi:hypothetical protein